MSCSNGYENHRKERTDYPQSLSEKSLLREAQKILNDTTHILNPEFEMLPSDQQLRVPKSRLNQHKNLLIPCTIRALNGNK